MIDRPAIPTRLPVPAGVGRGLVLVSVFVCAACGLVYELELIALASYLAGDSVTQASVVLSVMVFAMGIGSLLAKRLRSYAAIGFGVIEVLLALVGGGSAMALYATFAWFGASQPVMVGFSIAIGMLIGAEMPLLMTLIQRIRAQDAGVAVADLSAADYVGALVGGLTFPFLLLPFFGQMTGALLTGVVNAVAGGVVVLWLFRHDLGARGRWFLLTANAVVIALLVAGTTFVDPFERAARQAVYGGDVRVAVRTELQEVVLTGGTAGADDGPGGEPALSLFLDGRLRACAADEARFHESLVHPAMAGGPRRRVLILGGGAGLALREVVEYPGVRAVTVVERDPAVVELARTDPGLARLNEHAYRDERVDVVTADAFRWLRERPAGAEPFDVIVSALPDPGISASTKYYSQEFYGLAARALSPEGRLVAHAGSLDARPRALWTVDSTMRSVGLKTAPYAVDGRLSGDRDGPDRALPQKAAGHPRDWGFLLAAHGPAQPAVRLASARNRPRLQSLSPEALRDAVRRAERSRVRDLPPSTLMHPRFLD